IPNSCDSTCTTEFGCANDLVCSDGACRNAQCTTEGDCICPACGDGTVDEGEECDDGNNVDGDGCSASCTLPNACNSTCTDEIGCANDLSCVDGACRNPVCSTEDDCVCAACGDGTLDPGEQCDDGNNVDGDGCSVACTVPSICNATCTTEFGCGDDLVCSDGQCRNTQCTTEGDCICPLCGDGNLDDGEACDDGNNIDGDGCEADCRIPDSCDSVCTDEIGCGDDLVCSDGACRNPSCTAEGDCICVSCGDGNLDAGEACDDGNNLSGDGCDADCSLPNTCNAVCTTAIGCGGGLTCADGACRNALCTDQGNCVCTACGDGTVDATEECDDGNNIDGDGCSALCVVETPIPPLVVPPVLTLPTPVIGPVTPALSIGDQFCNGTVYPSGTVALTGAYTPAPAVGSLFQYSVNGGLSWNSITGVTGLGTASAPFGLTLTNLASGDYSMLVRVIEPDGTTTSSIPCLFSVSSFGLIFGANQFVLEAQQGPLVESGITQFVQDQPQQFYLEVRGASKVVVVDLETGEEYPLTYNKDLKLWTGDLQFDQVGLQRLEGRISNATGSYKREINSVFVSEPTAITDVDTGDRVMNASVTVYERDPGSDVFNQWNGSAYGQDNPMRATGGEFSLILPEGEFYLEVSSPTHGVIDSLITQIPDQSIVTADVQMKRARGFFARLFALFMPQDVVNNFPLQVTPLPDFSLLPIGEKVPDITVHSEAGNKYSLFDTLEDKYTVLMVYSEWNTEAQEQVEIFTQVDEVFGEQLQLVPITTMSPDEANLTYNERGTYDIVFLKPEDIFFDDYFIISLPHFFVLNKDKELIGQIVGSRQKQELVDIIIKILAGDVE
ncbi:MAG: DUF4215 domain-containing protein, partial [Candidatus Kerfeldbacteria bacterium]